MENTATVEAPPRRLPGSFEELTQLEAFKAAPREKRFGLAVEYMRGVYSQIPEALRNEPEVQRGWSEWVRQFEIKHLNRFQPMPYEFGPNSGGQPQTALERGFDILKTPMDRPAGPIGALAQGLLNAGDAMARTTGGRSVQSSIEQAKSAWNNWLASQAPFMEEVKGKLAESPVAGPISALAKAAAPVAREAVGDPKERIAESVDAQLKAWTLKPEIRGWSKFQASGGLGEFLKQENSLADWAGFLMGGTLDSAASIGISVVGGTVGGAVGGVPGAAAGAGLSGGWVEYSSRLSDYMLREAIAKHGEGIVGNGEAMRKALGDVVSDKELMGRLHAEAGKEGAAIGLTEAATGALSAGIAAKILGKGVSPWKIAGAGLAGTPVEMLGGSLGEFNALLASGKNPYTGEALKNIFVEGAIEATGTIGSSVGVAANIIQNQKRLADIESSLTAQGLPEAKAKEAAKRIAEAESDVDKLTVVSEVMREQAKEEAATVAEAPTIRYNDEGQPVAVVTPDGELEVGSPEEAQQALTDHVHLTEVRNMRDFWDKVHEARGDENVLTELIDSAPRVADITPAEGYDALLAAGATKGETGLTPSEARIFGSNAEEARGNQIVDAAKIYRGARFDDVAEEKAEQWLKSAIKTGEVDLAVVDQWLEDSAEIFDGGQSFEGITPERARVERFARRVVAYLAHERKSLPKNVRESVEGSMKEALDTPRRQGFFKTPEPIQRFLSKLAQHFRQMLRQGLQLARGFKSGKLSPDFQQALRKAAGIDAETLAKMGAGSDSFDDIGLPVSTPAFRQQERAAEIIEEEAQAEAAELGAEPAPVEELAQPSADAEYLAAVEAGDMAKAQEMVDAAAKAAGYTLPVYHFTDAEQFNTFNLDEAASGPGIWLTDSPAGWRGERRIDLYLRPGTVAEVKSQNDPTWKEGELSIEGIIGDDLTQIRDKKIDTLTNNDTYTSRFYVATKPEQVKSADPVTRDSEGNVIPLSQRFNTADNRITFSIGAPRPTNPLRGKPSRHALRLAARRVDAIERRTRLEYTMEKISHWNDGAGRRQMVDDIASLEALASILPPEVRGELGGFAKLAQLAKPETRRAYLEVKARETKRLLAKHRVKVLSEDVDALLEDTRTKLSPTRKEKGKLGGEGHDFFDEVEKAIAATYEQVEQRLVELQAVIESPASTDEVIADALDAFETWNVVGNLKHRNPGEIEAGLEWMNEALQTFRSRRRVIEEALQQQRQEWRAEVRESIGRETRDENAETERDTLAKKAATAVAERLDIVQALKQAFPGAQWAEDMGQRLVKAVNQRTDAMTRHRSNFRRFARQLFGLPEQDSTLADNRLARKLQPLFERRKDSGIRVYEDTGARKIDVPLEHAARAHKGEMLSGFSKHQNADIRAAYQAHLDQGAALQAAVDAKEDGAGAKLAGWKRRTKLSGVIIRPGTTELEISEMEAAYYSLLLDQPQYAERAEQLGFPPEAREQIEAFLSAEMKALRDYMRDTLRPMYDRINTVFERVNGVNLPQLDVYFPGIFESVGNDKGIVDPFAPENRISGMMDGFTKRRVPHSARRKRVSAFHAFFAHLEAAEHYVAFHEAARDMRAVLVNPDVQGAITAQYGAKRASFFRQWVELIESGGTAKQNTYTTDYEVGNWLIGNLAATALAFNPSTLLVQLSNVFAGLQRVSARRWAMAAGRLGRNPVLFARRVAQMWRESEVIQRRLANGFSPELAAVLNGDPRRVTVMSVVPQLGFELINRVDAGALAFGTAITYEVELARALKEAPTRAQAEKLAMQRTERHVQETQQPVDFINKSLAESESNPWTKLAFYMFISDARRKAANLAVDVHNAARGGSKARAAQTAAVLFALIPIMDWTLRGFVAALFRGREPEDAWDERNLQAAILTGPLNGFTIYGRVYEALVRKALGAQGFSRNPLDDLATVPFKVVSEAGDTKDAITEGDWLEAAKQLSEGIKAGGLVYAPLGAVGNILTNSTGFAQNIEDGTFVGDMTGAGPAIFDAFGDAVPRPLDHDLALVNDLLADEDKEDRAAAKAEEAEEEAKPETIAAKKTDLDKKLLELRVFGKDEKGKTDRSIEGRRVEALKVILNRAGADEQAEMLRHWVEVGVITRDVRRVLEREGFDVPDAE